MQEKSIYDYEAIRMLAEVARLGSLTRGAESVGVTQPALSQRIMKLEKSFGRRLLVRGKPCRSTESGQILIGLLDRVVALERDVHRVLMQETERAVVKACVNADSLATWFPYVLLEADRELDVVVDMVSQDQELSATLLERHSVSAIVTSQKAPVRGCVSKSLGSMIYCTVATKALIKRFGLDRDFSLDAYRRAPTLQFDHDDTLPVQWLRQVLETPSLSGDDIGDRHYVPSYEGYNRACLGGLGLGNMPPFDAAPYLASGQLVEVVPGVRLPVSLYWQVPKQPGSTLSRLTELVVKVAPVRMNGDQGSKFA